MEQQQQPQPQLFSEDTSVHLRALLERAVNEEWLWPQVYYYIIDELGAYYPDVVDSANVRNAIWLQFHTQGGQGNYEDYERFMPLWEDHSYRNFMDQPLMNALNNIPMGAIGATGTMNALSYRVPANTANTILGEPVQEGNAMVDFHGERNLGRYYKRTTYEAFPTPKRNPYTRRLITPTNLTYYRATVGGRRNSTTRKRNRKMTQCRRKRTRRTKRINRYRA